MTILGCFSCNLPENTSDSRLRFPTWRWKGLENWLDVWSLVITGSRIEHLIMNPFTTLLTRTRSHLEIPSENLSHLRKHCTGNTAFQTRSSQQEWNLIISFSRCGLSPTRQGRPCPSSSICQTSPGTRRSNSSIPSPPWWVFVNIFLGIMSDHSQVADLGGTFGLFVGFSFLGFFDAVVNISSSAINVFNRGFVLVKK